MPDRILHHISMEVSELRIASLDQKLRHVGRDGCLDMDLATYDVSPQPAGRSVLVQVRAQNHQFAVWSQDQIVKLLPGPQTGRAGDDAGQLFAVHEARGVGGPATFFGTFRKTQFDNLLCGEKEPSRGKKRPKKEPGLCARLNCLCFRRPAAVIPPRPRPTRPTRRGQHLALLLRLLTCCMLAQVSFAIHSPRQAFPLEGCTCGDSARALR